jgi:hypothetical protein
MIHLKLPKECGSVVFIDFLLKNNADLYEAKKAADCITTCLRVHFETELKKNLQFRGTEYWKL